MNTKGTVFKYPDNVDTDVIIPARYLNTADAKELAKHCMEDMETAYRILKGRTVAPGVRCIIIPATMKIYRECVERGYVTAFIDAGAVVSTPTCGPCLGGYMGILAEGERCVSTTNRNFVGRMGHVTSEVYLASPATAAASAIAGFITPAKED